MSKRIIRGAPSAALTLLAAASYGLLLPTSALASHTCTHHVIVTCQNWEELDYASQAECHEVESMGCGRVAAEPAGNPALAARDGKKLPRPAFETAPSGPTSAGAPPAARGR